MSMLRLWDHLGLTLYRTRYPLYQVQPQLVFRGALLLKNALYGRLNPTGHWIHVSGHRHVYQVGGGGGKGRGGGVQTVLLRPLASSCLDGRKHLRLYPQSEAVRPPLKKCCFLYSGWPKLWPVGRPQNLFFPIFFLGGGGGLGK